MMRYGDWGWGQMMGYGLGFGWISMIVFWAVVVLVIFLLVRALSGRGGFNWHDDKNEDSAMRILKERYAKGEIGKEEFEQKRKDIENMV